MSKGNCACCLHPERPAIDSSLLAGEKLKNLAAIYGVSAWSLSRHRAKHSPVAALAPESSADSLEMQARKWRERADKLWDQAEFDQDTRGLAQAVSAGLRSVELQARQRERDSEATAQADDNQQIPVEALDQFVQPIVRALAELQKCADQRTLEIAQALIHSDPDMLRKASLIAQRRNKP